MEPDSLQVDSSNRAWIKAIRDSLGFGASAYGTTRKPVAVRQERKKEANEERWQRLGQTKKG